MPNIAAISPAWKIHYAKLIDVAPVESLTEEVDAPILADADQRKFNIPKLLAAQGITDADLLEVENGDYVTTFTDIQK